MSRPLWWRGELQVTFTPTHWTSSDPPSICSLQQNLVVTSPSFLSSLSPLSSPHLLLSQSLMSTRVNWLLSLSTPRVLSPLSPLFAQWFISHLCIAMQKRTGQCERHISTWVDFTNSSNYNVQCLPTHPPPLLSLSLFLLTPASYSFFSLSSVLSLFVSSRFLGKQNKPVYFVLAILEKLKRVLPLITCVRLPLPLPLSLLPPSRYLCHPTFSILFLRHSTVLSSLSDS